MSRKTSNRFESVRREISYMGERLVAIVDENEKLKMLNDEQTKTIERLIAQVQEQQARIEALTTPRVVKGDE